MSEDNIFKPTPSRRAVTSSGLPLSYYFPTARERKQFQEDNDTFWDLYIAPELVSRNEEDSTPMETGPEETSKQNRQKAARRIRRRAEKHT